MAVGLNVVGVGREPDDVRHVEHLAVRRADNAVRILQVGRDPRDSLVVGCHEVNVLAGHSRMVGLGSVVSSVERVGEIDAAVRADPQVIRTIELFVAEVRRITVTCLSGAMDHNSFFSSAAARRLPALSKYIPFAGPAGLSQSDNFPSAALHFTMRSFAGR